MINPKQLQLVVDASSDGIVVAEQEGDDNILIYVNQAFENLSGYASADILYQDCRFLQGDDRDQPGLALIREALKKQQPCRQLPQGWLPVLECVVDHPGVERRRPTDLLLRHSKRRDRADARPGAGQAIGGRAGRGESRTGQPARQSVISDEYRQFVT